MEFRNNQARNINVLYFVLAKLVVNKLKEEKALDDLNFMIKVIIRNWKYLKSENMKSNEEYILNSFASGEGLYSSNSVNDLDDIFNKKDFVLDTIYNELSSESFYSLH